MTVETAERARDILEEIRALTRRRKEFEESESIFIQPVFENGGTVTIRCSKSDNDNYRYIKYLLDGIDSDLAHLQQELKRL